MQWRVRFDTHSQTGLFLRLASRHSESRQAEARVQRVVPRYAGSDFLSKNIVLDCRAPVKCFVTQWAVVLPAVVDDAPAWWACDPWPLHLQSHTGKSPWFVD